MKKIFGVGLILLVAAGSFLLPFWFISSQEQPSTEVSIVPTSHFLSAGTSTKASSQGQPILAAHAGRVWEVYFHEGQRVRKGQLLMKLVEKLPSVVQQQLQARLKQQQQTYDALVATQPVANDSALLAAQQQLAATREQLSRAVPMLSFQYVTAPADGIITGRTAATGDYLTAQTTVARLSSAPLEDTTLLLSSVE